MGYTTVADRSEAVDAAAALAAPAPLGDASDAVTMLLHTYPLLIDHVGAEAGVVEPLLCARALHQAQGDLVRAVSLVRAWAATLPRLSSVRLTLDQLRTERRITPAFSQPRGGQYLGASLDYAQRLLDLGDSAPVEPTVRESAPAQLNGAIAPHAFPRAAETLETEGLIAEAEPVQPADITRTKGLAGRSTLMQLLSRGETGTMTALAYTAIRGYGQRQDPTLMELRFGFLPVRLERPEGDTVTIGEIPATVAEISLYRLHDESGADAHFTLGVGATPGRVERRAIAAAMLDAGCARAASDPPRARRPSDDEEFIRIAIDGQEASGFVEHLKLPHYVTFTSDLDRVRAARNRQGDP